MAAVPPKLSNAFGDFCDSVTLTPAFGQGTESWESESPMTMTDLPTRTLSTATTCSPGRLRRRPAPRFYRFPAPRWRAVEPAAMPPSQRRGAAQRVHHTNRGDETADGLVDEAFPTMSVTVRAEDDLDISRGDTICRRTTCRSASNEIGQVRMRTTPPLFPRRLPAQPAHRRFPLIDGASKRTVGAGMAN